MLKIYLIQRTDCASYDEYDSAVVICENFEIARGIHPNGEDYFANQEEYEKNRAEWCDNSWVSPTCIRVTYMGQADDPNQYKRECSKVNDDRIEAYIICSSFNAGQFEIYDINKVPFEFQP